MHIAQLLSSLLNLGAQTDFWNSSQAARDFWIIFAVAVALVIAVIAVRSNNHHRTPRLRH
jgi:hypothetical protein